MVVETFPLIRPGGGGGGGGAGGKDTEGTKAVVEMVLVTSLVDCGGGGGGGGTPFLNSVSVMYFGFAFSSSRNCLTSALSPSISSSLVDNASTARAAICSASISRT